jgi:hypothetical protein
MMTSRLARRFFRTAALVATLGGFASDVPAFAQYFGYGGYAGYGPPFGYGLPRGYEDRGGRFAGPPGRRLAWRRAVASLLAERGMRLEGPLQFEGRNIVAIGVDPSGRARRFVIDAYQGEVLSARPLPSQAAAAPGTDGPGDMRGDVPPPAVAARQRSAAQPSEDQPVWRDEPRTTGSISHAAKVHPAAVEPPESAPPEEKHKPLPTPAAVQASSAPAHSVTAPTTQGPAASPAAPTGELEAPQPGG